MASSSMRFNYNKRKKTINHKKLFQFEDFAKPSSFRETIRLFLEKFGDPEEYTVNGMPVWCSSINTRNGGVLELYIVEEETVENSSVDAVPFCDHCNSSGWGHHFVSKRKYHLILPGNKQLKINFAEIRSHCLYAIIHCNGHGHLVCVSGSLNESNFTATDAMEFWENLCTILQARKISVHDDLSSGGIELRFIHGVAYGQPWFGRWGYKCSSESFGITEQKYDWAIRFLTSLHLDRIVGDFNKRRHGNRIKQMIRKYQGLSEKPLVTISDLLKFILGYQSRNIVPGPLKVKGNPMGFKKFVDSMVKGDCRWSARRLEDVLNSVVNSLKDHKASNVNGSRGMPRHELREETRKSIGDTGLIDFVLKSIVCFKVENYIIRRVIDPSARRVEFTIRDLVNETESMKRPFLNYDDCKWSPDKLNNAVEFVMSILMENGGNNAMSRAELRDRASEYISDTNLIDFVLQSLNISQIRNQVVYRTNNPITKRVEFAISENCLMSPITDIGMNFHKDVVFIYESILLAYPTTSSVSLASRIILESKQFVKEWPIVREVVNKLMHVTCQVLPSFDELETELTRRLSPGEVLVVPPWISIGELKRVVQCALRDTYWVMDEFEVTQIGGLKAVEDWRVLSNVVEPGGHIWIRGTGLDLVTHLRYEDRA